MENQKALVLSTKKHLLAEYAPQQALQKLSDVKTLPDVFKVKTPSLASFKKEYGEQFVIDYLAMWIITMNDMINISTKMNDVQVEYTARMVYNEIPQLTIADIKYVFDSALTGKYGSIYNRLDTQIICAWFRKHWNDRLEAAENESIHEHNRHNVGNYERSSTKDIQSFKDAHRKWYKEQQKKQI